MLKALFRSEFNCKESYNSLWTNFLRNLPFFFIIYCQFIGFICLFFNGDFSSFYTHMSIFLFSDCTILLENKFLLFLSWYSSFCLYDLCPCSKFNPLLLNTLPENIILLAILIFLSFSKTKFIKKMTLIYINKIISNIFFFCSLSYLYVLLKATKPIFFFNYYFFIDNYVILIKILVLIGTFFFLDLISFYLDNYSRDTGVNLIEFPILIAFSAFFMLYLVSSIDFFGAYICLEGLTFSLYILAGMNFVSQNSIEATIKYFCLGSLASGFLLFGISLIFLITNTLNFIELHYFFKFYNLIITPPLLLIFSILFIFTGFWFKLSIFPCHSWTPDVYEGLFTPITFYFGTIIKLVVYSFFVRIFFYLFSTGIFLYYFKPVLTLVAGGSIIYGALGALLQTKIKRFIGYTSINQMGFLFLGLSCANLTGFTASFLYLFYYLITTFAFFSIILYIKNVITGMDLIFINQLTFLRKKNKYIAFLLALFLFSMAGIPPLGGFFAKFFLFLAAFKCGNFGLLILALLTNIISVFYYLRLVKLMFFEKIDLNADPLKIKDVYFFIEKKNSLILFFYSFWFIVAMTLLFSIFWLDTIYFYTNACSILGIQFFI